MFQVGDAQRKRTWRALDIGKPSSRRRLSEKSIGQNDPLRGAVVCLTGLPSEEKIRLHRWVEQLGGIYTRDLDTAKTTHLIAQAPKGAKYDTAAACSNIRVVSPAWLETCVKTGERADEKQFTLANDDNFPPLPPLEHEIEEQLQRNQRSNLFLWCRFLLLGFDDDSDVKLGQLIRRGKGTIYWELNEMITHVIVADDCDDDHRDAARVISLHHPNGLVTVSSCWVLWSWKEQRLVTPSSFPPRKTVTKEKSTKVAKVQKEKRQTSTLFRDSVFAFLRLSPPSDAVDFDTKELERCITAHEGQMLASDLLEAIRVDKASGEHQTRTCYVVCWGGYMQAQITVHPLLSRVESEKLCVVVPVTPIWIQTCSADRKIVALDKRPVLFQPQPWPIRRLPESMSISSKAGGIKVSVTGFVGSERTGIIQMLRVLGALYTENMRSSNTHLICKEAKGAKYDKAVKWGLYVVSVNWLYHIMEYGHGGKDGDDKTGCEDRFSLAFNAERLAPIIDGRAKCDKTRESTTKEATSKVSQASARNNGAVSLHGDFELQWSQEVEGTEQVLPPE